MLAVDVLIVLEMVNLGSPRRSKKIERGVSRLVLDNMTHQTYPPLPFRKIEECFVWRVVQP